MGKSNASTVLRWLLLGFGVTVLIFLAAGTASMLESTIVNRWVFFGVITAVGMATGTVLHRLWGKLTGSGRFYINFPLHVVVFTIVASSSFLMINYFATDFDALPTEKVIIENRLRKTRYKTKRVSRRVYTRGAPYYVYYLKVVLPDSTPMEIYSRKKLYDEARAGDTAVIRMGRGVLSLPVADPHSLTLLHPRKSKKSKSRCKFFGTTSSRHTPTDPPLSRTARKEREKHLQAQED